MSGRFNQIRVLFVCTANLHRSPLAEHYLRRALTREALVWDVTSAGTNAREGDPMHPLIEGILHGDGIDTDGWTTHRLTADRAAAADLILTATADHRRQVATMHPPSVQHTFTLLQFARFVDQMPSLGNQPAADPGRAWLTAGLAHRAAVQPNLGGSDDIADPLGLPERAFADCARTVEAAVGRLMRPLSA